MEREEMNVTIIPTSNRLRLLIFGAGAIGTYVGGSLALSGHQVIFLERPEACARIIESGMQMNLLGELRRVTDPIVTPSIEEALRYGPLDAAIIALKSFDLQSALEPVKPFAEQIPAILSLQNGVENEAIIAKALGDALGDALGNTPGQCPGKNKVIAGTVTSAIGRSAAGEIALERLRGMGIAQDHPISGTLLTALNEAGLNARLYPSARAMKWSKLLTNLLANASSAILGMTPAEIFAHPGLYQIEAAQLREALSVIHAQGIPVVDLPATPVRLLAFAIQRLPLWLSRPLLTRAVGSGRGGKMPSFYIDLHSGRGQSEVGALNGAVVRFGEHLKIPTPVNRLLTTTLLGLSAKELALDSYARRPDKLIELWKRA